MSNRLAGSELVVSSSNETFCVEGERKIVDSNPDIRFRNTLGFKA